MLCWVTSFLLGNPRLVCSQNDTTTTTTTNVTTTTTNVALICRSGSHVPLGACELSVDTMLAKAGGQGGAFNLSTGTGAVVVHSCKLVPQPR